uniref:Very-long-chain 3-oxoacyl-CoA synthase n=1 Tax=Strongyloides venezuelensis TaxID=75913 RepID=A0A0K0FKM9_STRVS
MEKYFEVFIKNIDLGLHSLLFCLLLTYSSKFKSSQYSSILFHLLFGIVTIIIPQIIHQPSIKNGHLNKYHLYILRFDGAFHIGIGYYFYKALKNEMKIDVSVYFSKFVVAICHLIFQLITAYHLYETKNDPKSKSLKPSQKYFHVTMMIYGMWAFAEFIKFVRYSNTDMDKIDEIKEKAESLNQGNTNLALQKMFFFDSFVSIIYIIITLAFPSQIIKFTFNKSGSLDSFHKLYCRFFGAYMLYSAIMSANAISLRFKQQKNYAIQRAITQTIIFSIHVFGHWGLGIYSPNHITPFMISGFYITFILSIYFRVKNCEEEPSDLENESDGDNEDEYNSDTQTNNKGKLKTN